MHRRKLSKALDHADVRDIIDAEVHAEKSGKRLNTAVTIHPKFLDAGPAASAPSDVSRWLAWLTNKIRIWCARDRGFGYYAIWVRENYEDGYGGNQREHIHMLIHVPDRDRADFENALRRWLPGSENAIKITQPGFDRRFDRWGRGRPTNKALTYILKQMTPQARFALCYRVRRETRCRETHAPVAAVMGRRHGVSRSLNANARVSCGLQITSGAAAEAQENACREAGGEAQARRSL